MILLSPGVSRLFFSRASISSRTTLDSASCFELSPFFEGLFNGLEVVNLFLLRTRFRAVPNIVAEYRSQE